MPSKRFSSRKVFKRATRRLASARHSDAMFSRGNSVSDTSSSRSSGKMGGCSACHSAMQCCRIFSRAIVSFRSSCNSSWSFASWSARLSSSVKVKKKSVPPLKNSFALRSSQSTFLNMRGMSSLRSFWRYPSRNWSWCNSLRNTASSFLRCSLVAFARSMATSCECSCASTLSVTCSRSSRSSTQSSLAVAARASKRRQVPQQDLRGEQNKSPRVIFDAPCWPVVVRVPLRTTKMSSSVAVFSMERSLGETLDREGEGGDCGGEGGAAEELEGWAQRLRSGRSAEGNGSDAWPANAEPCGPWEGGNGGEGGADFAAAAVARVNDDRSSSEIELRRGGRTSKSCFPCGTTMVSALAHRISRC
mmetsp:Transcript_3777/g.9137  ORF Transcript_3777/g.9137 Transcript_3777/m.9137 type:complete len:361 (+) Transcript_3777:2250-3332(+)